MIICSMLWSQNSTLTIDVQQACGDPFTEPTEVKLFEILGNQKIQIGSSAGKPAVFNNLFSDRPYIVEVSSTTIPNNEISVEDLVHMHQFILGIEPLKNPGIFAGETNSGGGLSTIDLVQMTRDKLDVAKLTDREWFFVAEQNAFTTTMPVSDVINRIYLDKLNSLNKSVTFLAYEKYNITSTLGKECHDCGKTAHGSFSITTFNRDVVENVPVSVPLSFFTSNNQTLGCFFTLKVKNALIDEVENDTYSLSKISDDLTEVTFLNFSGLFFPSHSNIGTIRIIPLKNGSVWDFFELIPNSSEVVYKDGECLLSTKNVSITPNLDCPIEWPPLIITVPDCTNQYETGRPVFADACSAFMGAGFTDTLLTWPDGSCDKLIRKWTVLNWLTGEVIEKNQLIKYLKDYEPVCLKSDVFVPTVGTSIVARSLVEDAVGNHFYSFSKDNIEDSTRFLQSGLPLEQYFSIYDITDSTFCLSKVKKINNCDPTLNINSGFSLSSSNGFYTIQAKDFDGGNELFCLGKVKDFIISLDKNDFYEEVLTLEYESFKGINQTLHLKYFLNDTWNYYGTVKVQLLLDVVNHPPFEFQCYNDAVTKNEMFEIAFFSPTFQNIEAIQAALRITDGQIVKTAMKKLNPMTLNQEQNLLRFIWLPLNSIGLTLSYEDTLFTMTILPNKSGSLSEFLSIDNIAMPSEAVLDDLTNTKINLNFSFINRTTATKDFSEEVMISPNPLYDEYLNYYLPTIFNGQSYYLHSSQGKLVLSGKIDLDQGKGSLNMPASLNSGVYFLTFNNSINTITKKLVVIR